MQTTTRPPSIASRAGREAAAQADRMARPAPAPDPFEGDPPAAAPRNPGPARAAQAVQAAEQPLGSARPRAASYAPAPETLFLRDVAGAELLIYSIAMDEDQFGVCANLLVAIEQDVDNLQMVRASGFAAKTLAGVLGKIDAGECEYPLAARFDQIEIAGGKSCWRMI